MQCIATGLCIHGQERSPGTLFRSGGSMIRMHTQVSDLQRAALDAFLRWARLRLLQLLFELGQLLV